MLQNAYFLAKIGADTAENEQHFAENLPIGRRVADRWPPWRRVELVQDRLRSKEHVIVNLDVPRGTAI